MPDPDPLALSAAVLRAAGREVFQVEKGPAKGLWCWADYESGFVRLVKDYTRPENLAELVGLVSEAGHKLCLTVGPDASEAAVWERHSGEDRPAAVRMDSPSNLGRGLALAFIDAAGVDRPEGY